MSRALLVLYSLLLALALVLTAPWWLWQMARTGKYREGLLERLGRAPARLARPQAASVWVHAVSVGEVLAASRLVEALQEARPGAPVYVSTTTRTGQTLARARFGADRVFFFPFDFAFAMRAWLRILRPALVVLVESEFWPRMLVECRRTGIPVAVVNARISDRSWPRYQRLQRLWRPLLATLSVVLAQSEADAARLRTLGATHAVAAGNLKYDIRAAAAGPLAAALGFSLPAGVPLVVCGSTLAGEEALLLDALPLAKIVTVLAPRHPERFDEVERLLAARRVPFRRRASWGLTAPGGLVTGLNTNRNGNRDRNAERDENQGTSLHPGIVLLLDSIGELAPLYSLATLAILGGGFLHEGGHNPLEPAQFGVPVLMGTRYDNFRAVVDALLAAHAVVLTDAAGLQTTVNTLLAQPGRMQAIGARGRDVFSQQAGATMRATSELLKLLEAQPQAARAGQDQQEPAGQGLR